ncbi:NAD-dependent epimerase/dehydratase family protein [Enterococcus asini]|uniref:NAD-dependent epimerase/dehydratase family protein n=1 Tax=Enterococcus asini TaxID=57732 RepID=UPI0032E40AFC
MTLIVEQPLYQMDIEKVVATVSWDSFYQQSFLIIGASGMIGSFMVDVLMKANQKFSLDMKVYAMGRNQERLMQRFAPYLSEANFHIQIGDITKPLPESLQVDYLIHGASNTHPKAYATDPIGTIMTNLMGTEVVLKHAVTTNAKRVLFLSTVEVYGENRGDVELFSEDYCGYIDCNTLRAGYPEGKRVSESLCQAYIAKYGIDVVIPRLSRAFGPTMLLSDTKASSQFILNAVRGEDIVLKSAGTQHFSYIYVGDAVTSLLYLLQHGENGEAYNVAGGAPFDLRLKELAADLATIGGAKVVFELPDEIEQKGFSKASKALLDIAKLENLGWQPLFDKEEALRHTVEIVKDEYLNV